MKVLIIDDDKDVRAPTLLNYWLARDRKLKYIWLTEWPTLFLEHLEANPDITHISFDHDLRNTDVSSELSKLMWLTPERFRNAFKELHIIIHSMNCIGATNIANKLENVAASVNILPLFLMRGD